MKKMIFFATLVAAMVICAPANAQSRKDKKEAAKAQWEMEQQQKQEEAALRHQMKMDSLRNAQKVAEEKAAKADAERREKEAAARAKEKAQAERLAMQEVEVVEPCSEADFPSTAELIRAHGVGEDEEQQMSVEAARSAAIEELGSQISTKVQALVSNYRKSVRNGLKRESLRRIEGLTMTEVDQTSGYRVACRKTVTYVQNGQRVFKTYMMIELGADQILKPVYDQIQGDEELKIEEGYQQFKKDFNEHFANKSEEEIQQEIQNGIN